jgi:hypothetical protein
MSQLQVTGEAKIRDIQGPVVANSGVVTALDGDASQYVRGDGTLADFPTSTGGGSSVSYYLNSSVSQGTIGGVAYRQLGKTPIIGAGTDITISANGYVASYLTDANDPALLEVPAGNFNCEFYFSVNSNNHNPFIYAEVYKYDGSTFSLIGTSVGVPEYLSNGTTLSPYYFAIPVSQTVLTITDRIAIRIYVNVDGRVVTLHTENGHLCQVVTTFSKGLTSLNNLTRQVQFLATGTSGTDFGISSSVATHTFNLPVASAANTGKLSSTDWSTFNGKVPYTGATGSVNLGIYGLISGGLISNDGLRIEGDGINDGGNLQFKQYPSVTSGTIGYTTLSANDSTSFNIFFNQPSSSNYKNVKLSSSLLTNNIIRTYSFPDLSGTLALLEGAQTFTGLKTFGDSIQAGYGISLYNGIGTGALVSATYTGFYAAKSGTYTNVTFAHDGDPFFSRLKLLNNATYDYTFPAASGTIALTSNLSAYVTLATAQTISGNKTFSGINSFTGYTSFTYASTFMNGASLNWTAGSHTAGSLTLYGNTGIGFSYFGMSDGDTGKYIQFAFNKTANTIKTYTLPDANGTIVLGSGTIGAVAYFTDNGSVVNGSSNHYWDNVNNRLGIVNSSPSYNLDVNGTGRFTGALIGRTANFTTDAHSTVVNSFVNTNTTSTDSRTILNITGGNATLQIQSIHNTGIFLNPTTAIPTSVGYNNTLVLLANGNTTLSGQLGLGGALTGTTATFSSSIAVSGISVGTAGNGSNIKLGDTNFGAITTGSNNIAIGSSALSSITTSNANIGIGNSALASVVNGAFNIALGFGVGASITSGSNNTLFGYGAGQSITTGNYNTILGAYAGTAAMSNNIVLADGAGNIRYQWNGTNNVFTGAATFSSSVTATGVIAVQGTNQNFIRLSPNAGGAGFSIGRSLSDNNAQDFFIYDGIANATRLFINSSGNVGIGTSSPSYPLSFADNFTNAGTISSGGNLNGSAYFGQGGLVVGTQSTTGHTALMTNSSGRDILFGGWNGSTNQERMRITSGGNVLINSTTDHSSNAKLQVNGIIAALGTANSLMFQNRSSTNTYEWYATSGTIYIYSSAGAANILSINGSNGTYTPLSDVNKKKDFETSTIGLNAILGLKPTLYRMKWDDTEKSKELGFIAQEVKEFIPQAYVQNDDFIGLNYNAIVAALVKGMQEQQAQIEELKELIKNK